MKNNNNKGSSLIEVMVIMLIIVTGVTGMYSIYSNSQKMSNNLDMKIQAIQIAREGIEAMTNIRDTNWKMLSTNRENCWNTLNYDIRCVHDATTSYDITPGSYTLYQDSTDYKWKLKRIVSLGESRDYKDETYRNDYKIYVDSEGFYNQDSIGDETPFTREIVVTYHDVVNENTALAYELGPEIDSNGTFMAVESKVMWVDSSRTEPFSIDFDTYLSNWKAIK